MYRDDEAAHTARAGALIDEIAKLERERLALGATERRLEEARRELAALQPRSAPAPRSHDAAAHVAAYLLSAMTTFALYTLLA